MKKIIFILFAIGMIAMGTESASAMSASKVRKTTRFLTDRMAYELNLSPAQYNDAFEINFDFIYNVRYLMDDVIRGYDWALDDYYRYLDIRNDDLRWVLSSSQYRRFLGLDYFYRPIYASGNKWNFRVYVTYTNHNFFYFDKPHHYRSYYGGHYRTHFNNVSYYHNRYHHDIYNGNYSTRRENVYHNNRRSDFGITTSRPGTRPSVSNRPSSSASRPSASSRPSMNTRPSSSTRPSSTSRPSSSTRPSSNDNKRTSPDSNRPSGSSSRPSSSKKSTSGNTNSSNSSSSSTVRPSGSTSRPSSGTSSGSRRSSSSGSERSSSSSRR